MEAKAICIIGMHRSGTSTITRAINFLGAYLGEEHELHPAGFDNPEGFWERDDVIDLHERILVKLKRNYDTVMPLPKGWHRSQEIVPFREELRNLITTKFSGKPLWAWKDPRVCLFLDLWREVLDELNIKLVTVFVVRNPLDVANSLLNRNNIDRAKSLGFWLNHNVSALESISSVPTVFISYDRFLEEWEPELRRCVAGLGISWPVDEDKLRENMNSFVRPNLRHSKSSADELHGVPGSVRELYHLLLEQTTAQAAPDGPFFEAVIRLSLEFRGYASFFCQDLEACFERERLLYECERRLVAHKKQQTECECVSINSDIKITACENMLAEKDSKLKECAEQLTECDKRVKALMNSASWKMTAPFRWINKVIGKQLYG